MAMRLLCDVCGKVIDGETPKVRGNGDLVVENGGVRINASFTVVTVEQRRDADVCVKCLLGILHASDVRVVDGPKAADARERNQVT